MSVLCRCETTGHSAERRGQGLSDGDPAGARRSWLIASVEMGCNPSKAARVAPSPVDTAPEEETLTPLPPDPPRAFVLWDIENVPPLRVNLVGRTVDAIESAVRSFFGEGALVRPRIWAFANVERLSPQVRGQLVRYGVWVVDNGVVTKKEQADRNIERFMHELADEHRGHCGATAIVLVSRDLDFGFALRGLSASGFKVGLAFGGGVPAKRWDMKPSVEQLGECGPSGVVPSGTGHVPLYLSGSLRRAGSLNDETVRTTWALARHCARVWVLEELSGPTLLMEGASVSEEGDESDSVFVGEDRVRRRRGKECRECHRLCLAEEFSSTTQSKKKSGTGICADCLLKTPSKGERSQSAMKGSEQRKKKKNSKRSESVPRSRLPLTTRGTEVSLPTEGVSDLTAGDSRGAPTRGTEVSLPTEGVSDLTAGDSRGALSRNTESVSSSLEDQPPIATTQQVASSGVEVDITQSSDVVTPPQQNRVPSAVVEASQVSEHLSQEDPEDIDDLAGVVGLGNRYSRPSQARLSKRMEQRKPRGLIPILLAPEETLVLAAGSGAEEFDARRAQRSAVSPTSLPPTLVSLGTPTKSKSQKRQSRMSEFADDVAEVVGFA
jgi:hypothetical protein